MDTKKLTIINIVLIIAVAALFVLHFLPNDKSTTNNLPKDNNAMDQEDTEQFDSSSIIKPLKIAFVNSDTVAKYYDFTRVVEEDLQSKQSSAEYQVKKLYKKYEKMKGQLEKEYAILGDNELNTRIQELQKLEQEIMEKEQSLSSSLANKEYEVTSMYVIQTHIFMQKIGKELGYDYVFSFRLGGQMLYADPELDITYEVVERLNQAYTTSLAQP